MPEPLISVVIPHFCGDVLLNCLASVRDNADGMDVEIIVVDDGTRDDGSMARAAARFPEIRTAKTKGGEGYGTACNAGLRLARGEFVFFLNDDAEMLPGCFAQLLDAARQTPSAGLFQPKLLSFDSAFLFPWGGGCGGGIDFLGYPFMRGNLIFAREADAGQYDAPADVFWANGAALFARRAVFDVIRPFDTAFYMQMEDVDLGWRAQMAGIGVRTVPSARVRHHGGWTLPGGSLTRYYVSHRNSMVLLMKNAGAVRAAALLPARLAVEVAGAVSALLFFGNWRLTLGSFAGLLWIATHPLNIWRRRVEAQRERTVADDAVFSRMHAGSILYSYFFRGVRSARDLAARPAAPLSPPVPMDYQPSETDGT